MSKRIASRVVASFSLNLPIKLAMLDGGMKAFRIELDSQHGVLHPGQLVNGKIVIQLRENIKARAVVLHVVGRAKTSWIVWEERHYGLKSKSATGIRYSAEVVYVDLQINLWHAPANDQILKAGIHQFPFTFTLPSHCPPSFEGTLGFIRFYCKAKIDRPWKFDNTTYTAFTVMPQFDLNTVCYAGMPSVRQISKNIGILCFKHGRIGAKITFPKCGFVPGETISIDVDITNSTTKNITRIETSLIEVVNYYARRKHCLLEIGATFFKHRDTEHKVRSRTVAQNTNDIQISANSQHLYRGNIAVPPVVPSFNICPIIQVDYKLKVKIIAKGSLSNSVSGDIPILIGTIPVHSNVNISQMPYPSQNPSSSNEANNQDYLLPPQPSAPSADLIPNLPPPSYVKSVFGKSTVQEDNDEKAIEFAPKYVFYNNF